MTDAVSHRGPDGQGIWREGPVAFGHRRLSIVDLSELGGQPMTDPESGCVITYNGEVYNYLELRSELTGRGYRFQSGSDTEVILKAYHCWGPACVEKFNGMWAFAIHDPRSRTVFCSRDRFGVKPFYYADRPDAFLFGSEIRQILPFLDNRTADYRVLMDFLVSRIAEDPERTFFAGVNKLPGGHNLTYHLDSHRFEIRRYYNLSSNADFGRLNTSQAVEAFSGLFEDAIRLRLRSDVKVGTCLSGGMDSSSIASLAARAYAASSERPFSAITAISEDPATDESAYARQIVETGRFDWLTVKPGYGDFLENLDAVVGSQEEPFASASVFMQYFVMREARRAGIPVLLDGQGADETLLGYERYFADFLVRGLQLGKTGPALKLLTGLFRNGRPGALNALLWNIAYFHTPVARRMAQWSSQGIFRDQKYRTEILPEAEPARDPNLFLLRKQEIERISLPALLRYEDKNSMAHAVETRLPFLDYRLVELSTSLRAEIKLQDGWSKFVLRKAMDGRLPADIVWRRHKFGFEAPEARWMKMHAETIERTIASSEILASICDRRFTAPDGLRKLNRGLRWRMYSVALWARHFQTSGIAHQ